jgi:hypothetical protein
MKMNQNGKEIHIHELAQQMEADGFTGQGMRTPEQAHGYIMLAADDPDIEAKLPELGLKFWTACYWSYRMWQARKKRGLPIPEPSSGQDNTLM